MTPSKMALARNGISKRLITIGAYIVIAGLFFYIFSQVFSTSSLHPDRVPESRAVVSDESIEIAQRASKQSIPKCIPEVGSDSPQDGAESFNMFPQFDSNPTQNVISSHASAGKSSSDPPAIECEPQLCTHATDRVTLVTAVTTGQLTQLREFVGSLHHQRRDNLDVPVVVVYGFDLTPKEMAEIRLWRNVEFVDANRDLTFSTFLEGASHERKMALEDAHDIEMNPLLMLTVLDINIQKYGAALFVHNRLQFSNNKTYQLLVTQMGMQGALLGRSDKSQKFTKGIAVLGARLGTEGYSSFIKQPLQCARGFQCPDAFKKELVSRVNDESAYVDVASFKLIPHPDQGTNYCHILLRDDILYAFDVIDPVRADIKSPASASASTTAATSKHAATPFQLEILTDNPIVDKSVSETLSALSSDGRKRIRIAIGMPTVSAASVNSSDDLAPFKLFVPTFLKSVTDEEWNKFEYVIYIGYDQGDRFWDNPEMLPEMDRKLRAIADGKPVAFEYIRFPFSKGWVTYIWNGLFVHAMRDGSDYFFQVNDDLTMDSTGWTQQLVDSLVAKNNVGVAGPKDMRHKRRLLTQAFTHRTHFEIFGRFYPLDIKDWYSDDWISNVYDDQEITEITNIKITNTQYKGTRYNICRKPNYEQVLKRGKDILDAWRKGSVAQVLFQ